MTDLDLIREFRADVSGPDAVRLAAGRSNLMKTINSKRPLHPHPASPSWWLPALAVTAATAVAVGFLVIPGNHPAPRPAAKPAGTTSPAVTQAELAARVLRTAADVVTRAPVKSEPAPGQWIYAKTVQYGLSGVVSPAGVSTGEEWTTFDGSRTAYYQNGQLIVHDTSLGARWVRIGFTGGGVVAFTANATPKTAYDAIASLPADPKALLAVVDAAIAKEGGIANVAAGAPGSAVAPTSKGQAEFDSLLILLWNAATAPGVPPKAEAAAFRAMATIPGVTVQQGIADAAGAPAMGVSADGYFQLLLDPVSYQVIGLRTFSTGIGPVPAAKLPKKLVMHAPPKGTLEFSLAYASVREVPAPGAR